MNNTFEKEPYKRQEYNSYAIWKSLPSFLKGRPRAHLEKFGIEDESIFELLTIKNQSEFSKEFKVDVGTLSDWNKRIAKDGNLQNLNSWARKLTPNVAFALYKNITKHGRAQEVRAWYELIENN